MAPGCTRGSESSRCNDTTGQTFLQLRPSSRAQISFETVEKNQSAAGLEGALFQSPSIKNDKADIIDQPPLPSNAVGLMLGDLSAACCCNLKPNTSTIIKALSCTLRSWAIDRDPQQEALFKFGGNHVAKRHATFWIVCYIFTRNRQTLQTFPPISFMLTPIPFDLPCPRASRDVVEGRRGAGALPDLSGRLPDTS